MADLQVNLKAEVEIVEEKKARTQALIESIGQEKATVDEAVESSRADEEDAAKLQVSRPGQEAERSQNKLPRCQAWSQHGRLGLVMPVLRWTGEPTPTWQLRHAARIAVGCWCQANLNCQPVSGAGGARSPQSGWPAQGPWQGWQATGAN